MTSVNNSLGSTAELDPWVLDAIESGNAVETPWGPEVEISSTKSASLFSRFANPPPKPAASKKGASTVDLGKRVLDLFSPSGSSIASPPSADISEPCTLDSSTASTTSSSSTGSLSGQTSPSLAETTQNTVAVASKVLQTSQPPPPGLAKAAKKLGVEVAEIATLSPRDRSPSTSQTSVSLDLEPAAYIEALQQPEVTAESGTASIPAESLSEIGPFSTTPKQQAVIRDILDKVAKNRTSGKLTIANQLREYFKVSLLPFVVTIVQEKSAGCEDLSFFAYMKAVSLDPSSKTSVFSILGKDTDEELRWRVFDYVNKQLANESEFGCIDLLPFAKSVGKDIPKMVAFASEAFQLNENKKDYKEQLKNLSWFDRDAKKKLESQLEECRQKIEENSTRFLEFVLNDFPSSVQ